MDIIKYEDNLIKPNILYKNFDKTSLHIYIFHFDFGTLTT